MLLDLFQHAIQAVGNPLSVFASIFIKSFLKLSDVDFECFIIPGLQIRVQTLLQTFLCLYWIGRFLTQKLFITFHAWLAFEGELASLWVKVFVCRAQFIRIHYSIAQ